MIKFLKNFHAFFNERHVGRISTLLIHTWTPLTVCIRFLFNPIFWPCFYSRGKGLRQSHSWFHPLGAGSFHLMIHSSFCITNRSFQSHHPLLSPNRGAANPIRPTKLIRALACISGSVLDVLLLWTRHPRTQCHRIGYFVLGYKQLGLDLGVIWARFSSPECNPIY